MQADASDARNTFYEYIYSFGYTANMKMKPYIERYSKMCVLNSVGTQ